MAVGWNTRGLATVFSLLVFVPSGFRLNLVLRFPSERRISATKGFAFVYPIAHDEKFVVLQQKKLFQNRHEHFLRLAMRSAVSCTQLN